MLEQQVDILLSITNLVSDGLCKSSVNIELANANNTSLQRGKPTQYCDTFV